MAQPNWDDIQFTDEAKAGPDWNDVQMVDTQPTDKHAARLAELDGKVGEVQARLDSGEWEMGGLLRGHILDGKAFSGNVLFDAKTGEPVGSTDMLERRFYMSADELAESDTGRFRALGQGASLGFGDEIEAGVRSALGQGDYNATRADIAGQQAQYAEDNPGEAFALGMVGGAALPGVGVAGHVAKGAGLGVRALAGARAGAVIGGVNGAGTAEGGLDERAAGAVTGAGVGAVAGGLMPAVTTAVSAIVKPVWRGLTALLGTGTELATRNMISEAIARDAAKGVPFQKTVDAINKAAASGDWNAVVAEAGPEVRVLFQRAQAAGGEASAMLAELGKHGERAGAAIRKSAGESFDSTVATLTDERGADAVASYGSFYRQPAGDLSALFGLQSRPGMTSALESANGILKNSGVGGFKSVGKGTSGGTRFGLSSVKPEQADHLLRALDEQVDAAFKDGKTGLGQSLVKLRDEAEVEILKAFPDLETIRATYAAPSVQLRALEAGRTAPLTPGTKREAALAGHGDSPEEVAQGRLQKLLDELTAKDPEGQGELLRKWHSTEGIRGHLDSTLAGSPNGSPMATIGREAELKALAEALMKSAPKADAPLTGTRVVAELILPGTAYWLGGPYVAAGVVGARVAGGLAKRPLNAARAQGIVDGLSGRVLPEGLTAPGGGAAKRDAMMRAAIAELLAGGSAGSE